MAKTLENAVKKSDTSDGACRYLFAETRTSA
jgi:hypothetical protein